MSKIQSEPTINVGLITGVREVRFQLSGEFLSTRGQRFAPGDYRAVEEDGGAQIRDSAGEPVAAGSEIELSPKDFSSGVFTLAGVMIGIDFHWQRREEQSFQGTLKLTARSGRGLTAINRVPLESYVQSVIASEMSASCPRELLKAHAIISRSWLLAQRRNRGAALNQQTRGGAREIIRWTGRERHSDFDVCADDHCQRYQGIGRAFSRAPSEAVRDTRGVALGYGGEICDARFFKCCGGMTENYRAAWEEADVPYLVGVYDGPSFPSGFERPLSREASAERWIAGSPPAYCNTSDRRLLQQILPDYDRETRDFFRWEVAYRQDELRSFIEQKLGISVGGISRLEPVERGVSGRIIKLKIVGARGSVVVGKELEIRRALSPSHLYSSAFVVRPEGRAAAPERFRLIGAGWGHGVGLCQIGAAVMAQQGKSYREILAHYYRGSSLLVLHGALDPPWDETFD